MGEYFNGKKLGTCDHLMYVTKKEVERRVDIYPHERNKDAGNLDYLKYYLDLDCNFMYRFEFEDESKDSWDTEREAFKTIVFDVESDKVEIPHRDFHQMHLPNGECYNVPFCFYSDKAKELGVKKISSPNRVKVAIVGERYGRDYPDGYTVLRCNCCEEMFSLSEDESDYISQQLRFEGYSYEADRIKPRIKRKNISRDEFITEVIKESNTDMIVDVVGYYNRNADNVKELATEKLNSFSLEEINAFSRKHLCNYNITD